MMTEEEWRDFEKSFQYAKGMEGDQSLCISPKSIVSAYRELKVRREDEEWLKRYNCTVGFGWDGAFVQQYVGGREGKEGKGPTLHAAVAAAKGAQG
jgi:hypothetical protein